MIIRFMTVANTGLFRDNSEIFMFGSFYFAASLLFNAANSSRVLVFLTWSGAFGRANKTPVTTIVSPGRMPAVISTLLDNRMPVVTFEKLATPFFTITTWLFLSSGISAFVGIIMADLFNPECRITLAKLPGFALLFSSIARTVIFLVERFTCG